MFGYTACVCVCNLCNFNYFLSLSLNISFTTSMWSIWESLADVLHQQRTHANTQRAWSQYATSWRKFTSSICLPLFGRGTACTHIFMFIFKFPLFFSLRTTCFRLKVSSHFQPIFTHCHIVCSWKLLQRCFEYIQSGCCVFDAENIGAFSVHHVECFIDIQQCCIHNQTIQTYTLYAWLFCLGLASSKKQGKYCALRSENEDGKMRCVHLHF